MEKVSAPNISRVTINASGKYTLDLTENTQKVIEYAADSDLEVEWEIVIKENVQSTILFINNLKSDLKTKETILVNGNANIELGYLEISQGSITHQIRVHLQAPGATSDIHTATIAKNTTNYDIETIHESPNTTGNMKNYGIVVKNIPWDIVCAGRILKGCSGSTSHQTTRILTFQEPKQVKVLPILYIDEDDVVASHATSLGQPDEDELYYMETKGLDRQQAIGLITIGYLMPIAKLIKDGNIQKETAQLITKKVQTWKI